MILRLKRKMRLSEQNWNKIPPRAEGFRMHAAPHFQSSFVRERGIELLPGQYFDKETMLVRSNKRA